MILFLIKSKTQPCSFVVNAPNEHYARRLCADFNPSNGWTWRDSQYSTCEPIIPSNECKVIIADI